MRLAIKPCNKCGEVKELSEFHKHPNCKDGTRNTCRVCYNQIRELRNQTGTDYIVQVKLERGCADCGYKGHHAALDFDHLPGQIKSFSIGENRGRKRSVLDAEIAKCEVVCSNCHRIRTFNRRKTNGA